jgi:hypothetical protein
MFGKVHGEKEICFLVKGIILMDLKIVPLILVSTKPSQDFLNVSILSCTYLTYCTLSAGRIENDDSRFVL